MTQIQLTEEQLMAQKRRNRWLAFALVTFVVVVGTTTAIRLQNVDLSKSEGLYFDGSMDPGAGSAALDGAEDE
ncbi:MAG: hypothetical protein QNI84_05950 [Henriciella sp.]|nr:hypothetical protein [Henriciella sp.]